MSLISWRQAQAIVVFTGAGMSAESGVPTYRGSGGIWDRYRWQDYACQDAFEKNPQAVLDFHEKRRKAVLECVPHSGHHALCRLENSHADVTIITQNIDGMHQRAGNRNVLELHGSLWRTRCPLHGVIQDLEQAEYTHRRCPQCRSRLRPDIVWFGDALHADVLEAATRIVSRCDLFIAVGTSAWVWPAAGFAELAEKSGAVMLEINPEATPMSPLYHHHLREPASSALTGLFADAPVQAESGCHSK
ncbi:MAG: NAD-dependent deacylase [Acidobacteriota bacterium]|jgi:NAD-dependent deacetylase|nr:NAD-dependent deacylase [Acidobacteriota bacterium]